MTEASLTRQTLSAGPAGADVNRAMTVGIFVAACVFYLTSLDFATSGDAVYYANLIDTLRFDDLTLHQGYYVIGLVFARVGEWLFGASTVQSITAMNAFFGAGMLAVAYPLLCRYLGSSRDALIGVLMLLLSHRVFFNATAAEIYTMQTFFVWTSFLLFENRRFYWAGVSIALAMWISPLTVFFGLWFPLVAWLRGFGWSAIFKFAGAGALLYLPFLAVFYQELFWGTRGILKISGQKDTTPLFAAKNFAKFQFKNYSILNALLIPAVFALKRERTLILMTLALAVPNIYVLSKLSGENNVFILPLDLIFVCWFMVGWRVLRDHSLVWIAYVAFLYQIVNFAIAEHSLFRPANAEYAEHIREIGQIVAAEQDPAVLTLWSNQMDYVYYNRAEPAFPLEEGDWFQQTINIDEISDQTKAEILEHDVIFVIDPYRPTGYSELYMSEESLARRYDARSIRRKVERHVGLDCEPVLEGRTVLYRCR
jgi:hypothetical protein